MSNVETIAIYEDENHGFYLLGWEEREEEGMVQTNQYVIVHNGKGILLDPGGAHVFPRVLANVSEVIPTRNIEIIFYSHQDPDVSSGIAMWLSIADNAKIYISALWTRFLPHFGVMDQRRIVGIKDTGGSIKLSDGYSLDVIPAHFLHSPGQFSVYDPQSRILFTGDIGAAVFPRGERVQVVEDLQNHIKYMEPFHMRYMASNAVCKKWVEKVSKYDISAIAPQHGSVMKGDAVRQFLDWFGRLKCGSDVINDFYGR